MRFKPLSISRMVGGIVDPKVEPDVPVFWCVTEKSSYSEELPFGEVVYVDTASFY